MDTDDGADGAAWWQQQQKLEQHEYEIHEEIAFLSGVVVRLMNRIKTLEEMIRER